MDASEVISYVLAAAGILAIASAGWATIQIQINHRAGNAILMKLLAADNALRAIELCKSAPGSYFDAVGAALEAATKADSRDSDTVESAAHLAFADASRSVLGRWRRATELGLLGGILIGGAAALAMSAGSLPVSLAVVGAGGCVAAIWFSVRRRHAEISLEAARIEIMPAIIETVVGRPAGNAPKPPVESAPFRIPPPGNNALAASGKSLRDGSCPLCGHTTIETIDRTDPRFEAVVCASCGYTQEFAKLDQLA